METHPYARDVCLNTDAGVQTQVYGLLQKRGHRRKNFTLRLFVLDNVGVVSYYRLGETRVRGRFKLADVVRWHNSCMA